ncbi:reverse transcriptase domain-containing protein [Tanacetum coccineum]
MVTEGIVLGHKVSYKGLEVDKAKIDVIAKLPPATNVKAVRSFLGHARFYRRFIKYFSKISRPMTKLVEKDSVFNFDEECNKAFETLKEKLMNAPIMVSPNWSLPFELRCDASDFAVGAVLGQREEKHFRPIHFTSKTLNSAQQNYTVTEKELLAVFFVFDKFQSYLVLSKIVMFTDHAAIKYLFLKQDAKPRLIRWILLLQEFNIEIKNKKGTENVAADHLSRLEKPNLKELKDEEINDEFPDEFLMSIETDEEESPCTDHLIKDCDFYDKKSPEPKLKNVVNTGQRVVKPVWDNAKRVNHQKISNKLNYPQARRTFVPSGVLTRTCLVNPVRPNEKRAVQTINTARPVSTARSVSTARPFAPKTAQTSSAVRPIYLRMDNVRPRASYSPIKRFQSPNVAGLKES